MTYVNPVEDAEGGRASTRDRESARLGVGESVQAVGLHGRVLQVSVGLATGRRR